MRGEFVYIAVVYGNQTSRLTATSTKKDNKDKIIICYNIYNNYTIII